MRRIITLLAAGALALAPLTAAAAAAQRAPDEQLCYEIGGSVGQCARIASNNDVLNNPIVGGNDINGTAENGAYVTVSGTYDGHSLFEWQFASGGCLGSDPHGAMVIKNCSGPDPGAYGTVWAAGSQYDINRALSEADGSQQVLTGEGNGSDVIAAARGVNGDQFWLEFSAGRMVRA